MRKQPRILLGEMLLKSGVITQEQLDEALEAQKLGNAKVGEILVQLGYTTEDNVLFHLARQLNIPYMSLKSQRIDTGILNLIPVEIIREYNIIPIDKIGKFITIAMSNPLDDEVYARVGEITGLKVQKVVSTKKDIEEAIERYYATSTGEDLAKENQSDSEIKPDETVYILTQKESDELGVAFGKSYSVHQDGIPPGQPTAQAVDLSLINECFVPEYTFDNFIADNNDEVLQAAVHICNIEQVSYNPLLIYAEKGLGKTHLLHAIGSNITQNAPQKEIKFINCRELSLRIMNTEIYKVCAELCRIWGMFDILLFDDFHTLLAEKSNQEVFISIFDFLYRKKKQMVIASVPLDAVDYEIEVRLLSRIESGWTVKIKPPDFETRRAILRKWEEVEGNTKLSDAELNSIAERTYEDIRRLLATRNRIRFQTLLLDIEQKIESVEEESDNEVSIPAETIEGQAVEGEKDESEEMKKEPRLATLTFTSGSQAGSVVEIAQWEASIGRSGDIQVDGQKKSLIALIPLISRKHALLKFDLDNNKYEIEDTSKHGTTVNGELLAGGSKLLDDGDMIQLVKMSSDKYLVEMKLEYQE